eukprot:GEMP01083243.1.p1 GENE.GEMP01083243.1~~GEMP01083243.1.p1  ORF type:complete len:108 (-),score=6.46 GEMP01083243.1:224-547(-)
MLCARPQGCQKTRQGCHSPFMILIQVKNTHTQGAHTHTKYVHVQVTNKTKNTTDACNECRQTLRDKKHFPDNILSYYVSSRYQRPSSWNRGKSNQCSSRLFLKCAKI